MFNKEYIELVIRDEIPNLNHVQPAIHVFESILEDRHFDKTLSIYELSKLLNNKISEEELYTIAFEMIDLTLPIFFLIIQYVDELHGEISIDENQEIYQILTKRDMSHPIEGTVLSFNQYKNKISFLFRLNERLFSQVSWSEKG